MNLVEAVEYIEIVDELEFLDALAQLKEEIGNGIVDVQWKDKEGPQDRPNPDYLAKSELLPIGPGFARDAGKKMKPYRALLSSYRVKLVKAHPRILASDRFKG